MENIYFKFLIYWKLKNLITEKAVFFCHKLVLGTCTRGSNILSTGFLKEIKKIYIIVKGTFFLRSHIWGRTWGHNLMCEMYRDFMTPRHGVHTLHEELFRVGPLESNCLRSLLSETILICSSLLSSWSVILTLMSSWHPYFRMQRMKLREVDQVPRAYPDPNWQSR